MPIIATVALLAASPIADDFCDTLKRMVATAPANFDTWVPSPEVTLQGHSLLGLGSGLVCAVEPLPDAAPRRHIDCDTTDRLAPGSQAGAALAERVTQCLGATAIAHPGEEGFSTYAIDVPGAGIYVNYAIHMETSQTGPWLTWRTLHLEITGEAAD